MSVNLEEDYDKIYRYCYMKVQHRQTAEDITQETFLCFLETNTYKDLGKRMAFLYTIARNKCVDYFRIRKTEELGEIETKGREEQLVVSLDLYQAVISLDAEEQELIFLRYVNEISVNDISRIVGMSRFAVYRKLHGALKKLEEKLGKGEWF